jgi:hypothetical protein
MRIKKTRRPIIGSLLRKYNLKARMEGHRRAVAGGTTSEPDRVDGELGRSFRTAGLILKFGFTPRGLKWLEAGPTGPEA